LRLKNRLPLLLPRNQRLQPRRVRQSRLLRHLRKLPRPLPHRKRKVSSQRVNRKRHRLRRHRTLQRRLTHLRHRLLRPEKRLPPLQPRRNQQCLKTRLRHRRFKRRPRMLRLPSLSSQPHLPNSSRPSRPLRPRLRLQKGNHRSQKEPARPSAIWPRFWTAQRRLRLPNRPPMVVRLLRRHNPRLHQQLRQVHLLPLTLKHSSSSSQSSSVHSAPKKVAASRTTRVVASVGKVLNLSGSWAIAPSFSSTTRRSCAATTAVVSGAMPRRSITKSFRVVAIARPSSVVTAFRS